MACGGVGRGGAGVGRGGGGRVAEEVRAGSGSDHRGVVRSGGWSVVDRGTVSRRAVWSVEMEGGGNVGARGGGGGGGSRRSEGGLGGSEGRGSGVERVGGRGPGRGTVAGRGRALNLDCDRRVVDVGLYVGIHDVVAVGLVRGNGRTLLVDLVVAVRASIGLALGVVLVVAVHFIGMDGSDEILGVMAEPMVLQHAVACEDGHFFVAHLGRV